jgi:sigma-B regulation protein RsbU (phosphoserine phosphatase)
MAPQMLAMIPPFTVLPPEEIERLQKTLPVENLPAGKTLFQEGHSDDKFYILLEGQVEVLKSLGGADERFLGTRGAGTLLGEMSLFNRNGRHTASVRSITPLTLLKISHSDLDALLHRQPQLAYEIIRMFSNRLETSENITILELKEKNRSLQLAYEELKAAQAQIIEKERLEKELEIAAKIQRSILPESLPLCRGFEFGALMIPARQIGGDFYTFFEMNDDRLGIVVGDVCDKGIPAALFMALTYSLIRAEALRTDSPVIAFKNVNHHLLQMNSEGMFVTLVYGILDCRSGGFHFARVAQPTPLLFDEQGQIIKIPSSAGQPLGLFDELPIDEQRIQIPPGGTLMIYSDGVSEPENLEGKEFGFELLSRSVISNRARTAQNICDLLWQDVQAFSKGNPHQDDFTTVAVKRLIRQ